MLSDGDSTTYKKLLELNLYGETLIRKEECVNHVHKRMSMALRRLLTTGRNTGVTFGGRGVGRLTGSTILKLSHFFTNAVRVIQEYTFR